MLQDSPLYRIVSGVHLLYAERHLRDSHLLAAAEQGPYLHQVALGRQGQRHLHRERGKVEYPGTPHLGLLYLTSCLTGLEMRVCAGCTEFCTAQTHISKQA